jgi:hypothetical protein
VQTTLANLLRCESLQITCITTKYYKVASLDLSREGGSQVRKRGAVL